MDKHHERLKEILYGPERPAGCLMGRRVTQSPDPERLVDQLVEIAHPGCSGDNIKQKEQ